MYVNKCIKCGREFETKNPKRVICPDCLYPDKKMMVNSSESGDSPATSQPAEQTPSYSTEEKPQFYNSYSSGGDDNQRPYNRPQRPYNNRPQQGGYNRSGFNNRRPQQGGFNRGGFNNRRPMQKKAPKQLLVSKEQLEQIELLYKMMLPLPNPDCHEVIGEKIGLEPRKVFFGINLVRQKMMLPKLPFPKRKLAITPDQLFAIKNLYEPLLPLPPIGCHKIIAAQLKMDEWRVHVGIGLIRSQMGLKRWNEDRPDKPADFQKRETPADVKVEEPSKAETPVVETPEAEAPKEVVKPKRGRKPKKTEETAE